MRYCFGLVFLNPKDVGDTFVFELISVRPVSDKLVDFSNYLTDTYIQERPLFPPATWARKSASFALTTNACESLHSKLPHLFELSHPNMHHFIEFLRLYQNTVYIKLQTTKQPYIPNSVTRQRSTYMQRIIDNEPEPLRYLKLDSHY